jgi:hypothetical protein
MTDKAVQYYLDKDKLIDIRVDHWDNGKMYVSVYNDRNDSCVAYTCSREELKGLADFIYHTLQMNVAKSIMTEDSEALRNLSK